MAAGAIPPPLFFEQRRLREHFGFRPWHPQERLTLRTPWKIQPAITQFERPARSRADHPSDDSRRIVENMANTTSAKKATRKIARRTIVNKSRRTQMRGAVRTVEEAIKKRRPQCGAGSNEARGTRTDAGGAAQHHSQEQCEPEGVAPDACDRQAREVN
ncbi:hypothetical protein V1287_002864 [Bradyrhizobium sp. AZCC 1699]